MKGIIRDVIRIARGLGKNISWHRQYRAIIAGPRKTNFVIKKDWYKGYKFLMMVPHADDELISSYSILCNAKAITVYYCGFTGSNNSEENILIRRSEIIKLCSELKVEVIEGNENCNNLKDVLSKGQYDSILLPSIVDWHNEHRIISYMIKDVCLQLSIAPTIYCYSVTVPNESHQQVTCIPLSKRQLTTKYELFGRIYLSQKIMPIIRLKLNERINGYYAGCYAAESFIEYDFAEWTMRVAQVETFDKMKYPQFMNLIKTLRSNLNNLLKARQSSKEFYSWFESNKLR